ncbi:MAG: DUF2147 domain-containing protein [Lysobacter sp.]|nr:DUF2147 domain-containing protein [Lysobacter sp.]
MRATLFCLLLALVPTMAVAQQAPTGSWVTIDDSTGKPKSIVEIYKAEDGTLAGRVAEVLQSDRGPGPVCNKCRGDRRNKPVEGMVILWGMKRSGDSWEGGRILDPASGKIYSARLTPADDGRELQVRGFLGFSLLGRSQVWVRQ